MRPRFVAAQHFLIVAAILSCAAFQACGSDDAETPLAPDSGVDDSALATAICPTIAPSDRSECTLPEGTTCDFGQCATVLAQCIGGLWRFGTNAPPRPQCPTLAPEADSGCPECWPEDVTCLYGSQDCSLPDASLNTSVAACSFDRMTMDKRWTLEVRPCRDAGPDVQGDAGLDGD